MNPSIITARSADMARHRILFVFLAACADLFASRAKVIELSSEHRCKNVFAFKQNKILSRFLFLRNVGKVQSGKQINKKHFQNNSNETDL